MIDLIDLLCLTPLSMSMFESGYYSTKFINSSHVINTEGKYRNITLWKRWN